MINLEILKEKSTLIEQIEKLRQSIFASKITLGYRFQANDELDNLCDLIDSGYKNIEENITKVGNV